jgi:8-oxo-dGTP diphosphatase
MVTKIPKMGSDFTGIGVGAVIKNGKGQFLLTKRGPKTRNERGKWEFPGGALEYGELLEETLVNEMKEELAIDIVVGRLMGVFDHVIALERQHWVGICYYAKIIGGTPKILEPHKCTAIGWFSFSELKKLDLTLISESIFEELKKARKGSDKKR